jgi:hypothetical protein
MVSEAQGYRALWSQVVLQAKDDVETADFGSIDYEQAVNFFIGSGKWAETRAAIAEMVDLHSDDLARLGRTLINCRREQEDLPPLVVDRTPTAIVPLPALFATMPLPPVAPASARHQHIYGAGSGRINPFSPFRNL